MKQKKTLVVASAVQQAVLQEVLLEEIIRGFWKNARPADHGDYWKGVEIVVGVNLGPDFEMPRNYNFVNPDFFTKNESKLMAAASKVEPNINVKQLKKQLITLNQILGNRLKEVGGDVTKLARGKKAEEPVQDKQVKKVAATFVDPVEA